VRYEKSCGAVIFRKTRGKYAVLLIKNRYADFWSFPKGHVEEGENEYQTAIREVKEETGLTLTGYRFRGLITFVSDVCEQEMMCLYTADTFEGELTECNEGELKWIPKAEVTSLPTWEGDALFLKLLLEEESCFFSMKLEYEGDALVKHETMIYK